MNHQNYLKVQKIIIPKKNEISLKDLDPRIKEILILFVISNDYYQLLVQERAKKAFKFNKVKK